MSGTLSFMEERYESSTKKEVFILQVGSHFMAFQNFRYKSEKFYLVIMILIQDVKSSH